MSFKLFGGGNQAPPAAQQQANLAAAEQELEMVTDMFNKIVDTCHKKCIPTPYHDSELNKGEAVCIDRCVAKYFAVNAAIGAKLSSAQQR
ncbi:mrs11p [Hyaloraphidium curvatum]|nr:mrs11p [Hyaloraphidium curvatum]